jgi:cytochrome bd-type quinol oxidase subunit 2
VSETTALLAEKWDFKASLSFLFWGAGLFVLPIIAIYTIAVYWFFRGKMRKWSG